MTSHEEWFAGGYDNRNPTCSACHGPVIMIDTGVVHAEIVDQAVCRLFGDVERKVEVDG